jgi:flagellar hook-associated protein 3 FlgL
MDLYITNTTDAQMLAELNQLNATMNEAQQQVASGKKVQVASDDPADVQAIVQNQSDLARVQQSQTNLNTLNSEVGMASSVLENAAKLMDSARSIAAQAASSTTTASTDQVLASQIQDIESQMVGIANSTNAGRYLFSGDADTTAPYSIDFTNTPPFTANTTALATRMGLDSMGNTFPIAMTATDIFDNGTASNNILQSLEDLRQGLLNGDATAITTANGELASAATYLGTVQSFYGTAESNITSALDVASKSQLSLQTEQSTLTDADMAQAITTEESAQTQQQAVLDMRSKMPRGSLFDMLG